MVHWNSRKHQKSSLRGGSSLTVLPGHPWGVLHMALSPPPMPTAAGGSHPHLVQCAQGVRCNGCAQGGQWSQPRPSGHCLAARGRARRQGSRARGEGSGSIFEGWGNNWKCLFPNLRCISRQGLCPCVLHCVAMLGNVRSRKLQKGKRSLAQSAHCLCRQGLGGKRGKK